MINKAQTDNYWAKAIDATFDELSLRLAPLSKFGNITGPETINKKDLIESPFTIVHPKGIRGIFTPSEIDEILILTKELAA